MHRFRKGCRLQTGRGTNKIMGLFNNWFKSREDKLLDQIFNLKFTAKQLARTAAKCEREEKTLKAKVRSELRAALAPNSSLAPKWKGRVPFRRQQR